MGTGTKYKNQNEAAEHLRQRVLLLTTGVVIWCSIYFYLSQSLSLFLEYGYFFLVGLFGAIVANSTGAGGGIIFIPFFTGLGMSGTESLGTSILIQCFGMTAGSISWLLSMRSAQSVAGNREVLIKELLLLCGPSTVAGILLAQYAIPNPGLSMVAIFRVFSILFGLAVLINAFRHVRQRHSRDCLARNDRVAICVVCFVGGLVTAWISVGVGEWVALYLIFRRFPTMVAICMGVCVSSIAVLSASVFHIWLIESPVWEIVLFAAPAAILGGSFAKYLAFHLGAWRLKIFFGAWVLLTGALM